MCVLNKKNKLQDVSFTKCKGQDHFKSSCHVVRQQKHSNVSCCGTKCDHEHVDTAHVCEEASSDSLTARPTKLRRLSE